MRITHSSLKKKMVVVMEEYTEFASESNENETFGIPKITIVGCGGAGNNNVTRLHKIGIKNAETIAINTDWIDLENTNADKKILIGKRITGGRGTGGDPKVAKRCFESSRKVVEDILNGSLLTFVTAGMGGGTGTGIAPLVAEIAKDQGAIVIAIVTTPFNVEKERKLRAQDGIEELRHFANSVILLDNNKLLAVAGNQPIELAFSIMDQLIAEIIKGITESVTEPSLINLDFADLKAIMSKGGISTMIYGEGSYKEPGEVVARALNNPLLDINYRGATGAFIHITSGEKLSLKCAQEITEHIVKELDTNANVIFGARVDPAYGDQVKLMSVITGAPLEPQKPKKVDRPIETPRVNYKALRPTYGNDWTKWDIPLVR